MSNSLYGLRLLKVNRWFKGDCQRVRTYLGIPESGFENTERAANYARWLGDARNLKYDRMPAKGSTGEVSSVPPEVPEELWCRLRMPKLLFEWGIQWSPVVGASSCWSNENFDDCLTREPLKQHAMALMARYGLQYSDKVRDSIIKYILLADEKYLDFDKSRNRYQLQITEHAVGWGTMEVTISLPFDFADDEWKDIGYHIRNISRKLHDMPRYRSRHRFEYYRFMYDKVRKQGCGIATADDEWIAEGGELPEIGDEALRKAFTELETIMQPKAFGPRGLADH